MKKNVYVVIACVYVFVAFSMAADNKYESSQRDWFGQGYEAKENYILGVIDKEMKQRPQLGWFTPPDILISDKSYEKIWIYSSVKDALSASFSGPIDVTKKENIGNGLMVPCGSDADISHLYKYTADITGKAAPRDFERVVISSVPLPEARLGYTSVTPSQKALDKVIGAVPEGNKYLHRYLFIKPDFGKDMYSFHGFYDKKTKELKKQCMILWDEAGKIAGKEIYTLDPKSLCDGCGIPVYDEPFDYVYCIINVFNTSIFPWTVLIMNTGTIEGRAISLQTFDGKGKYSELRAAEYVVGCQ